MTPALNPAADLVELTRAIVDVVSVSGRERELADLVEAVLRAQAHLHVDRDGDGVVARSEAPGERVLLAGHLDTVPLAGNLPSAVTGGRISGCGASDMKAALAVMLRLAVVPASRYARTFVFYDHEEVGYALNGLGRLAALHPDWLAADFALLLEPTAGRVEAGCQGSMRVELTVPGRRAHSARSWLGDNAVHRAGGLLTRLAGYAPREVTLQGCTYREGLNAVRIEGGVAGNVIPDSCTVTVNYRYAPDRSEQEALDHVREVVEPYEPVVVDSAPAAPPGLAGPLAAGFLDVVGTEPVAKYGWTDVARFAQLGIPALNYGPGDPDLAHTREEYVEIALIEECEDVLRRFLG
ncbi:MAG: succinyl-diaminopimelate desuccinylase [Frankiaceae bacterium]